MENIKNDDQDSLYTFDEIYDDLSESYETQSIDNRPPLPLPSDDFKMVDRQDHDNSNNSDHDERKLYEERAIVDVDEHQEIDNMDKNFLNTDVKNKDVDIDLESQEAFLNDDHTYEHNDLVSHNRQLTYSEKCESLSNDDKDELTKDRQYENQITVKCNSSSKLQVPVSCSADENDFDDDRLLNNVRNKYVDPYFQKNIEKDKKEDNLSIDQEEMPKKYKKPPFPAPRKQKTKTKPDLPPRCNLTSSGHESPNKQPEPLHKETPKEDTEDTANIARPSRTKQGYENVYDYVVDNTLKFCVKGTPSDKSCSQNHEPELADRILEKRCLIESNIRVRHILGYLTFLDDTEEIRLKENESPKQAVSLLLDKICKKEEDGKWMTFMSALEREGYSYVVDVIKGANTIAEQDMLAHKKLLQVFHPRLTEDLNPEEIIDHLYEKHVISSDDMDEIRREKTNKGRKAATYMLLDRIPIRSPSWFCDFLHALRATDQVFLADEIEDTNRKTFSCVWCQENQESITYQKYITPGHKGSSDKQEDELTPCKYISEEVGLYKQLTEMQDKLKNKRKKLGILKQIQTVKLDLDSAQEEEETLLKVIGRETNSESYTAANVDSESAECEETMTVHKHELETIIKQSDPAVALTVLGTKKTIRFNDPSGPMFGLQELYSQSQKQQLIKIYDASCLTNPGPCLPKPHFNNISVDSGVFSAHLSDSDRLSFVIQ